MGLDETEEEIERTYYMCHYCGAKEECPYAWDLYNKEHTPEDAENFVSICLGLK